MMIVELPKSKAIIAHIASVGAQSVKIGEVMADSPLRLKARLSGLPGTRRGYSGQSLHGPRRAGLLFYSPL